MELNRADHLHAAKALVGLDRVWLPTVLSVGTVVTIAAIRHWFGTSTFALVFAVVVILSLATAAAAISGRFVVVVGAIVGPTYVLLIGVWPFGPVTASLLTPTWITIFTLWAIVHALLPAYIGYSLGTRPPARRLTPILTSMVAMLLLGASFPFLLDVVRLGPPTLVVALVAATFVTGAALLARAGYHYRVLVATLLPPVSVSYFVVLPLEAPFVPPQTILPRSPIAVVILVTLPIAYSLLIAAVGYKAGPAARRLRQLPSLTTPR